MHFATSRRLSALLRWEITADRYRPGCFDVCLFDESSGSGNDSVMLFCLQGLTRKALERLTDGLSVAARAETDLIPV